MSVTPDPAHGSARRRIRLLYVGDATLARECLGRPGGSIDVVEAADGTPVPPQLEDATGRPAFDVVLIEHGRPNVDAPTILSKLSALRVGVPVIVVAEWDEALAARTLSLGASDYVAKSRASLRAVYFRLHRLIATAAQPGKSSAPESVAESIDRYALDREQLVRRLTDAEAAREVCEWRLNDVLAALKQARQDRLSDAVAAAREQLERDSEFAARIRSAELAARSLEERLAQRDAALRHAEAASRQAAETAHATERRIGELESVLREELSRCRTLDEQLTQLRQAVADAEQRRLADAAVFEDTLTQERARTTVEVAQITRARDAFELRMQEAIATASQAHEQHVADLAAAEARSHQREADLAAELRASAATEQRLERRLVDADAALRAAEQRVVAAQQTAQQRANARQAEHDAELARQRIVAEALRQQLTERTRALEQSEHRRTTDLAASESRFNTQRDQYEAALQEAAEGHDAARARLIAVEAAFAAATEHHRLEMSEASTRFAEIQERAATHLSQVAAEAVQLETRLTESERDRQRAHDQHVLELAEAAARLAQSQRQSETELATAAAQAARLEEALAESQRERQRASEQHASEMAAAAARLSENQRQAEVQLAAAAAQAAQFERELAESERQRRRASEQHASEMTQLSARHADRLREADARFAQSVAANVMLENRLIDAAALRQQIEERHAAELADAASRHADYRQQSEMWLVDAAAVANQLQAQLTETVGELDRVKVEAAAERAAAIEQASRQKAELDRHLAEEIKRGDSLAGQLWEAEAALQRAGDHHAAEMTAAGIRLAEMQERADARLAQAATAIKVAESKRAEMSAALNRVVQQATAERQAAAVDLADRQTQFKAELADRQTRFEAELAEQIAQRHAIEQELTAARAGFELAERRLIDELAVTVQDARDRARERESRAQEDRNMWDRDRLELESRIAQLDEYLSRTRRSFAAADAELERVTALHAADRAEFDRLRAIADADFGKLREDRDRLQLSLDQTRVSAEATIGRLTQDRASEREALDAVVADRDAQLRDLAERKRIADQAAAANLAALDRRLQEALEARQRDLEAIAEVRSQLVTAREMIATTARERDAQKAAADRVPVLQQQIDAIRATGRREFEACLANRFRCRRNGTVVQVNQALADLLGYGSIAELQRVDFREGVFDSGDELSWLINRCVTSHAGESIETMWRKRDGTGMVVRLLAVTTGTDTVDIVVENITPVRTLEERLRHAQRMESVARYGSEIVVTCHAILKHVKDEGEQWLSAMEGGATRYHGELLLDEVTRAARLLGQLAIYGDEQTSAPELVELNAVLRDLAPVLKRVVGENIDVVLPKSSTPLTLDVEARPVERMLVNVAAFGRERMPRGGRLMIDVDSVVVDREFVAKHPHVRPGAHVLLTVNEVRRPDRHDPAAVHMRTSTASGNTWVTGNPSVELGTLQALVTDCGGHLWMKAEPPGDMVLKIHLPRRVLDRAEPAARSRGPQWIRRAFGSRH